MSNKPEQTRKENRESAQKKIDKVQTELTLTDNERRELHDSITGDDYISFHDLIKLAKSMFDPINISSKKVDKPRW